jgi:transposase InsO family protein
MRAGSRHDGTYTNRDSIGWDIRSWPVSASRFYLECLDQHWFLDIVDARAKIQAWCQDYNNVRPDGAIGTQVLMALVRFEMNRISPASSGPEVRERTKSLPL